MNEICLCMRKLFCLGAGARVKKKKKNPFAAAQHFSAKLTEL